MEQLTSHIASPFRASEDIHVGAMGAAESAAACPVDHEAMKAKVGATPPPECPMHAPGADGSAPSGGLIEEAKAAQAAQGGVGAGKPQCPVDEEERINPLNNMPFDRQKPMPGQRMPLSTDRVVSSIPRVDEDVPEHQEGAEQAAAEGGGDPKWVYPSPQQFFNAMRRKGWEAREEEVSTVVSIHNYVNETTWRKVLQWESLHPECEQPRLAKLSGRPKDFSPKARMLSWIGNDLPFDRHDWEVDRCGTRVRYVIDFYRGKPDPARPFSFHVDVRPALDSPQAVLDRARMAFREFFMEGGALDIASSNVASAPAAPLPPLSTDRASSSAKTQ